MEFPEALHIILKFESGYSNKPSDPGGETNMGISKRAYPKVDILNLTRDQAADIYKSDYWDKCHCDELPAALRLIVFDCAVNQGLATAIGFLQACMGQKIDGVFGSKTLEAIKSINPDKSLQNYAAMRFERYWMNPRFGIYGQGWLKRLLSISILSSSVT